jgi:ABC-type uncharacterized transport system permease subunit
MLLAILTYGVVFTITTIFFITTPLNNHTSHIIFSIIGWALLCAGFIISFIYNYQKKHLHSHDINTYINILPALDSTERLLFSNIYSSLVFLSLAIISGFIFLEDMFAQHLVHKKFFAIMSWGLIAIISYLRIFKGLRDKKATLTIQIAFISLVLGYFGSNFVLSVLLS